jgi:hypothetical protein
MTHRAGGGDAVEIADTACGGEVVGHLSLWPTVHALEDRSKVVDVATLGVKWGEFPIDSVGATPHDVVMELITTVGAIVAGVVMVLVGAYSIAAILFDDLAQ